MLVWLEFKVNSRNLFRSAFRDHFASLKADKDYRAILAGDPNNEKRVVTILICNSIQPCQKCPKHLTELAESIESTLNEEIIEFDQEILWTDLILPS